MRKKKAERYITIKSPEGYKIVKQEYLGEVVGEVKSVRVFFELKNRDKLTEETVEELELQ